MAIPSFLAGARGPRLEVSRMWGVLGWRDSGQRGMTIIELMLALIMLSLLIVGVLGLMGSLLTASTKSTDTTAGVLECQFLLDNAKVTGPPSPAGGITEGVREVYSHEEHTPVDFNYRMEWELIAAPGQFATVGADGESVLHDLQFGSNLYRVTVQMWWMIDSPEQGRAEGGGKRNVTLERFVTIENEA